MIGIATLLIAIPVGITVCALIGVWIGKGVCALSEWKDDENESGSNPL